MAAYQPSEEFMRCCILYEYHQQHNATVAWKNLNATYPDRVSLRKVQMWFAKFRDGDFDLKDKERSGRPSEVDDDALLALVEDDPGQSIEEIARKICKSWSAVQEHLKRLGKAWRAGRWVPHLLNEQEKFQRVSVCSNLLTRNALEPFIDRIITGDEKWVLYDNPHRHQQWLSVGETSRATPKSNIHGKKVLLCIWWHCTGIVYMELLEPGQTITAERYCQQLQRLAEAACAKFPALANRKGILLQQDNARPHSAKITQQKIRELGWEVLPHPTYSPDVAPSDYYLFRSLQHFLAGKKFGTYDHVKNALCQFFESKGDKFYREGMENLVSKWQNVIDHEGNYFED